MRSGNKQTNCSLESEAIETRVRDIGVDEAGRGARAGPVYAAAVMLDPLTLIVGLAAPKLLNPKQRDNFIVPITLGAAWQVKPTDEVLHSLNAAFGSNAASYSYPPLIDAVRRPTVSYIDFEYGTLGCVLSSAMTVDSSNDTVDVGV